MLAQAGLDAAVGGVMGPLAFIWLMAVGYFLGLFLFGLFVAGVRCWYRFRNPQTCTAVRFRGANDDGL